MANRIGKTRIERVYLIILENLLLNNKTLLDN